MRNCKHVLLRISLVAWAACCFHSCGEEPKKSIETRAVQFIKEGELRILRAETDSVLVSLDIEIADSEYETQTGLMYRKEMKTNRGMLFVFEEEALHSFYMKNTLIPLDILFIDQELKIATIQRNAPPMNDRSIPSEVPVQYVLEVNAGMCDQWGVQPGDRIRYDKMD